MNTVLFLIIGIPLIEIYLFIKIGSQIGALVSERQSSVIPSKDFLIEKFNSLTQEFENKDIPRPENWGGA